MNPLRAGVEPGTELFTVTADVDRDRLVRYAGASGDFNPIHYNDRFATEVGLPGVIAHGMLTMGLAASALSDHLGDPGDVLGLATRFTRPVPVPDPGRVQVRISATVRSAEGDVALVDLAVKVEDRAVLGKAQAKVRLH